MQVLINLDDETYNRIKDARSVPDMYGTDIVNGLNAIKYDKVYYTPTGEQIPEDELLGAIDQGIEALRVIESNKGS